MEKGVVPLEVLLPDAGAAHDEVEQGDVRRILLQGQEHTEGMTGF